MTNAGGENTDECRAEFAVRMANGEEFERDGCVIKFDVSRLSGNLSPFVIIKDMVAISLEKSWRNMDEWELSPDWRDELSEENPRWCKVWNDDDDSERSIDRIWKYRIYDVRSDTVPQRYHGDAGAWEYAEPLDDDIAARINRALAE